VTQNRKFEQWARQFGLGRLARVCGVGPKTPQHWINGRGLPNELNARRIVELSRAYPCGVGPLKLEEIIPPGGVR
jgi:hypothetical protein